MSDRLRALWCVLAGGRCRWMPAEGGDVAPAAGDLTVAAIGVSLAEGDCWPTAGGAAFVVMAWAAALAAAFLASASA